MLIITAHDFGHRLRRDGLMESAPFDGKNYGAWEIRSPESMNMTGAMWAWVHSKLEEMSFIFPEGFRLPSVREENPREPLPEEIL